MANLIDQLEHLTEEILTKEELAELLASKKKLTHYIGFEISGLVHIGHVSSLNVVKPLQDHGAQSIIWLADWHSYINNKLGGSFENIRTAAKYFEHAMRAALLCHGVDHTKVQFLLANDTYTMKYWELVMAVAKNTTLSRTKRSLDIAGRTAGDSIPTAILFYPSMQAADIFFLGVNIAHAGMDQRKAHIVARDARLPGFQKPVSIHTHILQGLQKPSIWPIPEGDPLQTAIALKMSKSKPDSAIFIHDEPDVIASKIKKAFCPPKETKHNPIIDWTINLILKRDKTFTIERPAQYGGTLVINNPQQLIALYEQEQLSPVDLKNGVTQWIQHFLEPAREYFKSEDKQKLLEQMRSMVITR
ncbi:tyrosine--tRNA ligase [Candidatus Roizmanbacteria bacterium CG10_big_fil_rev_8_21_14_0_10_45_7]|uniref:tyrosine--tRNA ligase n=1 Tax=Candidatus Roizmanbacteria bacterium CG10_big_fil_rev_8_21_14_0_10_45_7 TaxID=1974854 RepID=A0A2M8KVH7_9BACT|nr:MAG: tyrosine--tRNA ligase [Candidatus Roizmanbacteria bacterium CG10_big_fil_rev_8_21_14_0_10_45_7]